MKLVKPLWPLAIEKTRATAGIFPGSAAPLSIYAGNTYLPAETLDLRDLG
jgi:hypothetical protein